MIFPSLSRSPILLFHGGTGSSQTPEIASFLGDLFPELKKDLREGRGALSLAVRCVTALEESGLFNAGKGAIAQGDGVVRRDAGAMEGVSREALGILQVEGIWEMARLVQALLGKSSHVLLNGMMARDWARRHGFFVEEDSRKAEDPSLFWDRKPGSSGSGTVGCVARDVQGNLAAVTSTGGIGRMWPGRIGDSSIVGAGFYADNDLGAISMTGAGESILKSGGGIAILARLSGDRKREETGSTLEKSLRILREKFNGTAGCVGVDSFGVPFVAHTSESMVFGVVDPAGESLWGDGRNLEETGGSPKG